MPLPVGRPAMAKRTMFRLDAQAVADLATIRKVYKCATDAEAIRLALRIAKIELDCRLNNPELLSRLAELYPDPLKRATADKPRTHPTPPASPSTSTEH
jgi:hypothetical protein